MRIDMCMDMCTDMRIDTCTKMCIDMRIGMRIGMCMGMGIDWCIRLFIGMCIDTCPLLDQELPVGIVVGDAAIDRPRTVEVGRVRFRQLEPLPRFFWFSFFWGEA